MTTTPTIWKSEFTANIGNTTGFQFNPYTIGLANGNILVVWTDDTNGSNAGNDIIGQIFDPEGNPVGAGFPVNQSFFVDGEFLGSIAALPGGGFVVAYVDDEGAADDAIRIERYDAAGVSTFVGSISSGGNPVSDPEITVAPNGNYMVTFTRTIAGDIDVRGVIINGVTNAIGAEFDAAQNSSDRDANSDVAGLTNGSFVTVYEETDSPNIGIEFKVVDGTGAQVALVQVDNGPAFDPHVAALTGGGFAVVWDDSSDIRVSIFNNTGGAVATQILVAGGANAQNEPKVVGLQDGGFFVVWDDDTLGELRGQRFSAAGAVIGGNVIIGTGGGITDPEVGLTDDGRILVTFNNNVGEVSEVILDPRDNVINGSGLSDVLTTQIGSTTIFGGTGDDTILGQGGNDSIQGGFGSDSIRGGAGNDTIAVLEGEFSDSVDGGSGTDTLDLSAILANGASGDAANIDLAAGTWTLAPAFPGSKPISSIEVIIGTQGNDTIVNGNGLETIDGQGGDDLIRGGFNVDSIRGGAGNDTIAVLEGEFSDSVDGGAGIDTLDLSNIAANGSGGDAANIDLGAGTWTLVPAFPGAQSIASIEVILGTQGNDTIINGGGNETIDGGLGNDLIRGGFNVDSIRGGVGDDTIAVLEGEFSDSVDGGAGTDTLDLSTILANGASADAASIDLAAGTWTLSPAFPGAQSISSIEVIVGTQGNDTIVNGNGLETIDGQGGNDLIRGGFNVDSIRGGTGDDTIAVLEGEFIDDVDGGVGTDTLDLSNIIANGAGGDAANIDLAAGTWTLAPAFPNARSIAGIEAVLGTQGNDTIVGAAASETLNGQDGNDTLFGAEGNDEVLGNAGNDSVSGSDGNDTVNGGTGNDTVNGGAGNDQMNGGTDNDVMNGGAGNDSVIGGDGNDLLNGQAGVDTLRGGLGDDTFQVDAAGEANELAGQGTDLVRSTVNYTLGANLENLTLQGAAVVGTGNGLDNRIIGNAVANQITGGLGVDTMTGGGGPDVFDFNNIADSGVAGGTRDIITDFQAGSNVTTIDQIDLSTIDANTSVAGNQAFILGGAGVAGHALLTQSGANVLVRLFTDNVAGPDSVIQLNGVNVANLNAGDFIL